MLQMRCNKAAGDAEKQGLMKLNSVSHISDVFIFAWTLACFIQGRRCYVPSSESSSSLAARTVMRIALSFEAKIYREPRSAFP